MTATPKAVKSASRTRRILLENLTGYAFIAPAFILILLFGLIPLAFALFVSFHQWRRFPGDYLGLRNYIRGLDDFAYVVFFWVSLGLLIYAGTKLIALWRGGNLRKAFTAFIPAVGLTATSFFFTKWVSVALPVVLNIPQRIRGQERVPGMFVNELMASFQMPDILPLGNEFLLVFIIAMAVLIGWWFVIRTHADWFQWLVKAFIITSSVLISYLVIELTLSEINTAIATAREAGTELPIWSQIVLMTLGVVLIALAYIVWRRSLNADGTRNLALGIFATGALAVGGYLLIAELPVALANSDPDVLRGLNITVMFAIGTIPFQIGIGLVLAYLLFQEIKARSLFRVVYFLPYIMPFVATAIVFNLLFSFRPESPINQLINLFGIPDQKWLLEPKGIFTLIFGEGLPSVLTGPSLALIVIMIYTVWTYIGYDAVVFLAGLGNIPVELYEAARIDGASEWVLFRRITLPLLSPTTFFLMLIAITGTFKAFTQLWIMRTPAAASSVDTLAVHIFTTVRQTEPNLGYGSALAFVLFAVILLITVFQNRFLGSKVFYG